MTNRPETEALKSPDSRIFEWWANPERVSPGWCKFVGENYQIVSLECPNKTRLRLLQNKQQLGPHPYLVTGDSGTKFKLLIFPPFPRPFWLLRYKYKLACKRIPMPRVYWQDRRAMLLEYIDGHHPEEMTDGDFAAQLGAQLGKVQRNTPIFWYKPAFLNAYRRTLLTLRQSSMFSESDLQRLADLVKFNLPNRLPVSLDIADIKPENFILDANQQLRLIDLGSLRLAWPRGQQTLGDNNFPKLDQDSFWANYLRHTDNDFSYTFRRPLRLVQLARNCATVTSRLELTSSDTVYEEFSRILATKVQLLQKEMVTHHV